MIELAISSHISARRHWRGFTLVTTLALLALPAPGATTDLAGSPLQKSAPQVKPNLLFILDNSGSMAWDFMPDWAEGGNNSLVRNSGYNATYYSPAIQYVPPVRADGSSYPSMSAATTNNWRDVPFDGFGVQNARDTGNNLFTRENSGSTQNLVGNAYYYTFIPGEYCTDLDLKNCVERNTPSSSHLYPALLRWCSNADPDDCRATRIDPAQRNGPGYTAVRAPGMPIVGRAGVAPGSNLRTDIVSSRSSYPYPGTAAKHPARKDCAGNTCTYAEEMTNFANWWAYYRTRMQMAKSATSIAFKDVDTKLRIGFMTINHDTRDTSGKGFLNVDDVDTNPSGHKFQWYTRLLAAEPGGGTPLRTALSTAGRYFAAKATRVNGVNAKDPMQYACQRNYTMLSTDGYWNDRDAPGGLDANAAIGDQDGANGVPPPYRDGTRTPNTLSDIAQYFYMTDLRSPALGNANGILGTDVASNALGFPDQNDNRQSMRTSTVGLGASGQMQYRKNYASEPTGDYTYIAKGVTATANVCDWQQSGTCTWPKPDSGGQTTIDDLWHAAVNGRGTYYSAANPVELQEGLRAFVDEVGQGAALQIAPATVSTPNLTESDNEAFASTFTSGSWFGDVMAYELDAATGDPKAGALWSLSEPKPSVTGGETRPVLDNARAGDRKIYTAEPVANAPNKMIAFKWENMADITRRHFRATAIGTLSQLCASGTGCLPASVRIDSDTAGENNAVGGINLVNFLRGDRRNDGKLYRQRAHVLGDIVDAEPVYVKAPVENYADASYRTFRTNQANRPGMLYVGANDGMLHAFKAATGEEAWAFIPSTLLPSLYKLADKDYANRHVNYVNATPTVGDVLDGGNWRTILVGGLGQGGRSYYALDITDGDAPPRLLWEFTHDRSRGNGYITDEDLGYTYGKPIITRLKDGTWVAVVTSGYNNISPGSGKGIVWVLNAMTGRIVSRIDTGAGSASQTQPGCAAAPCPSGLAHLSGFDDQPQDNVRTLLYGGDLFGNVWRIDISKLNASGGSAVVTKLATLTDPSGNRQPVTSPPELGKINNHPVVYMGTGQYLGQTDIGTRGTHSMYAIKDPMSTNGGVDGVQGIPRTKPCNTPTDKTCFAKLTMTTQASGVRQTSSSIGGAVDFATQNGWFVDLPFAGERITSSPELQLGILAFKSGIPTTAGACRISTTSFANYVDYKSGLKVPGMDDTGFVITGDEGGPSGGLKFLRTTKGKPVLTTPTGQKKEFPPNVAQGTRRISWRELITDQ